MPKITKTKKVKMQSFHSAKRKLIMCQSNKSNIQHNPLNAAWRWVCSFYIQYVWYQHLLVHSSTKIKAHIRHYSDWKRAHLIRELNIANILFLIITNFHWLMQTMLTRNLSSCFVSVKGKTRQDIPDEKVSLSCHADCKLYASDLSIG